MNEYKESSREMNNLEDYSLEELERGILAEYGLGIEDSERDSESFESLVSAYLEKTDQDFEFSQAYRGK
ncbi:MAG: hypothetical protein ACI8Z7_000333 [Candidatus Nanohaloarchaea archaeon]|jgi:hypothetical protein